MGQYKTDVADQPQTSTPGRHAFRCAHHSSRFQLNGCTPWLPGTSSQLSSTWKLRIGSLSKLSLFTVDKLIVCFCVPIPWHFPMELGNIEVELIEPESTHPCSGVAGCQLKTLSYAVDSSRSTVDGPETGGFVNVKVSDISVGLNRNAIKSNEYF
ncbi:hypothetical protein DAPPUDRAFT_109640 [Daphnia pulex]|uniref:Uncharacterized protein n=1 Tax=Daphnia pulex TaxID=6669 RepID=E9H3P5_DAPPU|nr:hypothetical protein DAPPUDRAFT_109640 [Daphnia pulex]|eukprot:EFX73661.1 hypothetical protein DAPPUDRAFT_109640 [Daphnia pulex]